MSDANDKQKVAIITGASSGIGRAAAIELARRGYDVVLAARRMEKLAEVAAECDNAAGRQAATCVQVDVADAAQVEAMVKDVATQFGKLDVMVNNAGYGVHARVHETTEQQMRQIMDVNFFGVFHGCRAAAAIMTAQRSGHIFNVSSVIGKRGTPFNGAYCATKFAVCGLTDSLRVEMLDYNVKVTSVCPGLTQTDFFRHVDGGTTSKESSFKTLRTMQRPEVIAKKIAASIGKNVPELVFTPGGKFLTIIAALFPRITDLMMKLYHDDLLRSKAD